MAGVWWQESRDGTGIPPFLCAMNSGNSVRTPTRVGALGPEGLG
jgi:hypothetical protein